MFGSLKVPWNAIRYEKQMSDTVTFTSNDTPRARALRNIRQWIHEGQLGAGDRLPTEESLCEQLGVARTTVRAALKELETEGLIQIKGRGRIVTPPHAEATTMHQTVVVVTDPPGELARTRTQLGWGHFIHYGVSESLGRAGLHVLTILPTSLKPQDVKRLVADQPRGVIAFRHAVYNSVGRELLDALLEAHLPTVVYGDEPGVAEFDTVASDHACGEYKVTRWMIENGCKRIMRCWEAESPTRMGWVAHRDAGYERAMKEAGMAPLPHLGVCGAVTAAESRQDFETAKRLMTGYLIDRLSGPNAIDGLLAISDTQVFAAAAACRMLGKEPNRDVIIAGYDNYWPGSPERQWETCIPRATVDKQNVVLGRELVKLLTQRLNGELPDEPVHRLIEPELIVNDV